MAKYSLKIQMFWFPCQEPLVVQLELSHQTHVPWVASPAPTPALEPPLSAASPVVQAIPQVFVRPITPRQPLF